MILYGAAFSWRSRVRISRTSSAVNSHRYEILDRYRTNEYNRSVVGWISSYRIRQQNINARLSSFNYVVDYQLFAVSVCLSVCRSTHFPLEAIVCWSYRSIFPFWYEDICRYQVTWYSRSFQTRFVMDNAYLHSVIFKKNNTRVEN